MSFLHTTSFAVYINLLPSPGVASINMWRAKLRNVGVVGFTFSISYMELLKHMTNQRKQDYLEIWSKTCWKVSQRNDKIGRQHLRSHMTKIIYYRDALMIMSITGTFWWVLFRIAHSNDWICKIKQGFHQKCWYHQSFF